MKKYFFLIFSILFILFSSCLSTSINSEIESKIKNKGYPLIIHSIYTSGPDSAGGVNCSLRCQNISDKEIKYIVIEVVPFNAVNDVVSCTITRKSTARLKITGPINSNEKRPTFHSFGPVWWNSTIKRAEVQKIEITYMDNSFVSYNKNESLEMCLDSYK